MNTNLPHFLSDQTELIWICAAPSELCDQTYAVPWDYSALCRVPSSRLAALPTPSDYGLPAFNIENAALLEALQVSEINIVPYDASEHEGPLCLYGLCWPVDLEAPQSCPQPIPGEGMALVCDLLITHLADFLGATIERRMSSLTFRAAWAESWFPPVIQPDNQQAVALIQSVKEHAELDYSVHRSSIPSIRNKL